MTKSFSNIDAKINDHIELIHVIEEVSKYAKNDTYSLKKAVLEDVLSYLIELQIIKAKEL